MAIPVRPLGPAALPASSLGFGCMSLTGFVAFKDLTEDEKAQGAKVLRRALDLGVGRPVPCFAI
jgi:aryl-alcohol dehydrogenase-like predicted oxidoreductase